MTEKLNEKTILRSLERGLFSGGIHLFDSIASSNDWSLDEIRQGRSLPFACIADHQTRGRGRRGRHWLSPAGANVYVSLAWQFELPPEKMVALPLVQGVAVIRALNRVGIDKAWLKWPNDVLIHNEKIAGILVETSHVRDNSCIAVIGIGVNYCMPKDVSMETNIRWTDVSRVLGESMPGRNSLVALVLDEAVAMCRQYQHKSIEILSEYAHKLDGLNGRNIHLQLEGGERLDATVLGLTQLGELRVLVQGQERVFNSADISLNSSYSRLEA